MGPAPEKASEAVETDTPAAAATSASVVRACPMPRLPSLTRGQPSGRLVTRPSNRFEHHPHHRARLDLSGPMSLLRPAAPLDLSPASAARARRHMLGLYLLLALTVATSLARHPAVRHAPAPTAAELGRILPAGAPGPPATRF